MKKVNYKNAVAIVIFAAIPILACYIMCLRNGIRLNNIYLPNSQWNDELFYYKLVESVASYNEPLGYFGYNESYANIGGFGPWSPVLFVFYVLYAKVFGWTMSSPIYCNIILMTVSMLIFAYLVRPTKKQTLFAVFLYLSATIFTRYIFSAMPEVTIYALLVIYLGIAIKMYRQTENDYKNRYLIGLNVIAFLLVLMRPYWILLFVVPGYFWYEKYKKRKIIVLEVIIPFSSMVIYWLITSNFCASYFKSIINMDWLRLLFSSPVQGIQNIVYIFLSSIWTLLQNIGEGIISGSPAGGVYTIYIISIFYFLYKIGQIKENKKEKLYIGYYLMYSCIMLLAIFYLYDINVGSRHVMAFILVFLLLLSLRETSNKRYLMILSAFIWIFCIRATEPYTYQVPVYTEEKELALSSGMEELSEEGIVEFNTDNPWDNTIIWLVSDETTIDFTYLYAIPKGMGINLCFKDFVLNNFSQLNSRYIMVNIGEEVDLRCEQEKKDLIAEYGNVHIWKLR